MRWIITLDLIFHIGVIRFAKSWTTSPARVKTIPRRTTVIAMVVVYVLPARPVTPARCVAAARPVTHRCSTLPTARATHGSRVRPVTLSATIARRRLVARRGAMARERSLRHPVVIEGWPAAAVGLPRATAHIGVIRFIRLVGSYDRPR